MIDPNECPECLGLGTCPECVWDDGADEDCETCGGFRDCPECEGTGLRSAVAGVADVAATKEAPPP